MVFRHLSHCSTQVGAIKAGEDSLARLPSSPASAEKLANNAIATAVPAIFSLSQ
jgi:hypothetical protein